MRIIDEIKEKNLLFVAQEFLNKTFYEIYCGETKVFQNKNNFSEATQVWTNFITGLATK